MSNCIAPGWGSGPWGQNPWGGSLAVPSGGSIPVVLPFDVYCVGPCGPISVLLTYAQVSTIGNALQFPIDFSTMDQEMASGGTYPTTDAAIIISDTVPENFTLEFTVDFEHLPPDFTNLVDSHAFFGAFSPAAGSAGLFFSKIGIAYTGALHIDGAGDLVLDTPVQELPGSQTIVGENEYWTVRIAMSYSTGAVYIYVTLTSELLTIGHQLRYVLPAIPSSSAAVVPPSQTLISVRGTLSSPTFLALNSICLGTGLIIPSLPPQANAGVDQALRLCSIVQLDGSASYDPQVAPLLYLWQLIGAPDGSQYVFYETDGLTYPASPPTGFTNRLYADLLQAINSINPIPAGNVIVVAGQPYTIVSTGTDSNGFFVMIDGYDLPDNLSTNSAFMYLLQNGLNTQTSEKPTFYPDVAGIYQFSLVVFDGSLFSAPATVIVNVVESVVARGCTPDLSFLWNYLSDFWNMIEDSERITTFWQGLAQVAAAELLTLWQVDYSKSLRDIQRTFQRRWLHYDMLMQETPSLIELSTVRAVYGGIESVDVPSVAGVSGVAGTHLDLQLSTLSFTTVINFGGTDPYTPVTIQAVVQAALGQLDSRIIVRAIVSRNGAITRLRIDAPFPITVLNTSTCPLYATGQQNAAPTGTMGVGIVTVNTYKVDRSLQYLNIQLNDFLCIDGTAYRIATVVDDPSDQFYFQRVTLLDPLPVPADVVWTIGGTVVSKDLDFWNGLCEVSDIVTYEVLNNSTQALTTVTGSVLGSCSALTSNLPVDATAVGAYLAQPAIYSVFLQGVLRRKYIPLDPLITDVPLLQELIVSADDTAVLRRNADYYIDTFRGQSCLRFVTPVPANAGGPDVWQGDSPPAQLWAETSYLDNRPIIEQNFGILAGFTLADLAALPSTVDYLSAVQGLWYTYWNGPTVYNIRVGTQILLGLPFAEQTGVILQIRPDFSPSSGQILIQDAADSTIVREYTYPASLALEINPATNASYAVGDTVQQFAPLVTGVEISDWVNKPTWFQGYLEQGAFFEVEKFFQFLVRVDSAAFNLSALLFARQFVLRIKPTYTYPLFVVLLTLNDTDITTTTTLELHGTLIINDGACFANTLGVATIFDQARPGGGGWRSQFDHNMNPLTAPTYPTPNYPIVWGFDKNYLCPEDFIMGTICTTFVGPTLPTYDSLFQFDEPVYTADMLYFEAGLTTLIPAAGLQVEGTLTVPAPGGVINSMTLQVVVPNPTSPATYNLVIKHNNATVSVTPFNASTSVALTVPVSITVATSDTLAAFIQPTGLNPVAVAWDSILVEMGVSVPWFFDTDLAPGTYCTFRTL